MKKLVFILLIIPPAFLFAACGEPPEYEIFDDPDIPDVIISDDWRFITIYLDGAHLNAADPAAAKASAANSRNLTPDTARKGFDFFEVVFCNRGVPVRESWEIGRRASVFNVQRGVDYSQVSLDASGYNPAAILFAGRKRDKTLLAVGKVFSVDDVPGTIITEGSSFVTFEVFALTGRKGYEEVYDEKTGETKERPKFTTVSYEASESCFVTAYDTSDSANVDNTRIINMTIGGRSFPLYKLPPGKADIEARYRFELDGVEWDDFSGGVLVSSVFEGNNGGIETGSATIRNARYPAGSGRYWYPVYPMDETTEVRMLNNQIAGRPAENEVRFKFDTVRSIRQIVGRAEIGVFTLGFRIPVTPLLAATKPGFVSPSDEGEIAGEDEDDVTWFIRPAYQSYYYNIDNGVDSTGGGVLMGAFYAYETELIVNRRSG